MNSEFISRPRLLRQTVCIAAAVLLLSVVLGTCVRDIVLGSGAFGASGVYDMSGTILIDPGHGGFDGGAVAADGTVEKDINLSVSLSVAGMLRLLGFDVSMTRDSDIALDEAGITTIRSRKVSDMKARLKMYDNSRLVVSIHQNHFTQSQYFGTQVIYGGSGDALPMAESIRQATGELLEQEKLREIKKGGKDLFLLYNSAAPVVLVECGFLSNPQERENLKSPEYQRKIAFTIVCGMLPYV